jgi:aminoglycoside phosphotransferase (APT) family kinase protein
MQFLAASSMPLESPEVTLLPLRGGLESAVVQASVRWSARRRSAGPRRFVIKELRGAQRREAAVYQELWDGTDRPPTARVLGMDCVGDAHYLFLEEIRPPSSWPWGQTDMATAVCRVLAKLHDTPRRQMGAFGGWDYEAELAQSARDTLDVARFAQDTAGGRFWNRMGDLRRVVAALPAFRAEILAADATGIHGDMHPGNVIMARSRGRARVVLIDWARARIGSALEDVACWLHSLGCWEAEARRRHDTLLRSYLDARKVPVPITSELRRRYWLASASNGLAGAIRYHLAVLGDARSTERMQADSRRALPSWERVIQRAAGLLAPIRLVEDNN